MKRILVLAALLAAVGCGGDTKPTAPAPEFTPDQTKAPKPPKGEKLALPQ